MGDPFRHGFESSRFQSRETSNLGNSNGGWAAKGSITRAALLEFTARDEANTKAEHKEESHATKKRALRVMRSEQATTSAVDSGAFPDEGLRTMATSGYQTAVSGP